MRRNPEFDGVATPTPWYRDGLRFECTRCGHCCSGTPGTVRVSEREIEKLARHVSLSIDEFRIVYTRTLRKGEISLREKRNKECVFFDRDRGCSVYEQRPRQCRTWPFWRGVVVSKERWTEEAQGCPGMNRVATPRRRGCCAHERRGWHQRVRADHVGSRARPRIRHRNARSRKRCR